MAMKRGVCRFGLWRVHVTWSGNTVYRVLFSKTGDGGDVPPEFRLYFSGKPVNFGCLNSTGTEDGSPFADIYREVLKIPYGQTATYGDIADLTGTNPRMVGNAMKRNPTPIIIPCHRVVSKSGIGGFTPDVEIKRLLLAMENANKSGN